MDRNINQILALKNLAVCMHAWPEVYYAHLYAGKMSNSTKHSFSINECIVYAGLAMNNSKTLSGLQRVRIHKHNIMKCSLSQADV